MGEPDFIDVFAEAELPEGAGREVQVAGRAVAIFRVEGRVHAIDGVCPHRGGPLGEGDLAGHKIYCPVHAWCFDVRTGESVSHPGVEVRRYEVRVEGGRILVHPEGKLAHPPLPFTVPE